MEPPKFYVRKDGRPYDAVKVRARINRNHYRQWGLGDIQRPASAPCAICGNLVQGKNLHADHDHQTHQFRGWLCILCNLSLAQFEKYPSQFVAYLERR